MSSAVGQQHAEIIVRFQVIRLDRQGAAIARLGLLGVAELAQHRAEILAAPT
jgi:hypothetical protein